MIFFSIADGLIDCGDSKCCSHPSCRNSIMCMYLEDPVEVLLRKPPPSVSAPFLKRVQFLFEGEDSVQNYAKQDAFEDKYVNIFFFKLEVIASDIGPLS